MPRGPRSRAAAAAAILLTIWTLPGCGRKLEQSDSAAPLPLAVRDPAEDAVDAGYWPGWRGRNGQGIAASGSPATQFGPSDGIAWKIDVPGEGWSSPVVWDETILLTTATEQTSPPMLRLLAYSREDGTPRWDQKIGQAIGGTHAKNGYASATPVTDGKRVYSFFGSNGLFCHDLADGALVWHADLGDLQHMWGTAASPILYRDLVIQLCDCAEGSYLAAFDRETGRRRWRADRSFSGGCWTTPVLVETAADDGTTRTELVVNGSDEGGSGAVRAYDPTTGRLLWTVHGTTQFVTPTAVVSGKNVISVSGRKGPILAVRTGGSGDVGVSHLVWRRPKEGPYIPSPVVYRNRLFVLGDSRTLDCYDAGDGRRIWRAKTPGKYTASLVAAGGRLYAVDEAGTVSVFAADDEGKLLAENRFRERCLATPAVVDGYLFLRTASRLYCIAPATP